MKTKPIISIAVVKTARTGIIRSSNMVATSRPRANTATVKAVPTADNAVAKNLQ